MEGKGFDLERADLNNNPGQITAAIFSALYESSLCIADLSFLNANVMYELGVRHALQKSVIQIARIGTSLPFDTANQRTLFFDPTDVHSLQKLGLDILKQLDWIEAHPGEISNPLTAALGVFENAASADPQANLINQLVSRITALEAGLSSTIAPAVIGQGELATRNTSDLRRLWRADQAALALDWRNEGDEQQIAQYRGFDLLISPQSKGRWSSAATEKKTGFSVPWPVWQSSAEDAKATIVRAVDGALAERES